MKNTEAFETFITNVVGREGAMWTHYLNNATVNRCVQNGFHSGMTEVETLRALIIVLVHLADKDLEDKMLEMMNKPSSSLLKPR